MEWMKMPPAAAPVRPEVNATSLRWVAVGIFLISSVLNYLDRQILATLAPDLKREFGLDDIDYGFILSAFSITYAASSPFVGAFLDRVGLNRGISISVAAWSLVSMATSLVRGFSGLLVVRGALGLAESGAIPSVGKVIGMYLPAKERALGNAFSQVGLSTGLMIAPLFAPFVAARFGWQATFTFAGLLGLIWVPVWYWTARKIPPVAPERASNRAASVELLRDRRFWLIVAANFLGMTVYTLWTNWTNLYLDRVFHLKPADAAWFAWAPPLAGSAGALLGGYLSFRWIGQGVEPVAARRRACLLSSAVLLLTAAIPLLPTPALATFGISMSFFWAACWSTNIYTIPVDIFGGERAGLAISGLVFAYGAVQTLVSPLFGWLIKYHGFEPVCILVAVLPLASYGLLKRVGPG